MRNDKLLTVTEMRTKLRIGRDQAYELCRRPDFPCIRIGRNIRISEDALHKWIEHKQANKIDK